ncbi:alpha-glucosidase-like [Phymastichus coffea]|uniref:alpha-glucosidase-like n=1 Tax=Phymastichus coffea TaxID=108790 RepID=UPI00273AC7E2|nr:alpha-glucosidase-like [Phymastichus coffea]
MTIAFVRSASSDMLAAKLIIFGLLVVATASSNHEIKQRKQQDLDWWKSSTIYQIYPRSFKDSNSDGIGDLNGITDKLEHIRNIGADALWLSPIYSSPQKDFGYDISNFTDIHEEYGTLADFDKLVKKAKSLELKVLLDFVPNHSSDEHEWFKKSIERIKPYNDYYIWRDGKKDASGKMHPPNNWLSRFGRSAWEWNNKRKQYYYHAFVPGQPDLNYRNAQLREEMKNVLNFWMKRGVDGFRIDAINFMFESEDLKDEPKSGKNVPANDWEYLSHIYTLDLNETYGVVESWQKLIEDYVRNYQTDGKFLIMEAYTTQENVMKYYTVGANPFNFMFISDLNVNSTAVDFKRVINNWINAVPKGKVLNWVTGNHDNHRVASRFGKDNNRADQISMLASMLPGIMVVYNGDEIGMVDRFFTYEETIDPAGCSAGPERYQLASRDPERTPFQWDDSISAGFSNSQKTWLPVHDNYKTLNLAKQEKDNVSHYKVFQALMKLKKTETLQKGKVELIVTPGGHVLVVVRRPIDGKGNPIVLLINFEDREVNLDISISANIPPMMKVYTASVESGYKLGTVLNTRNLKLPRAASVILE